MFWLVYVFGSGSSLALCPRNDFIITQDNTDNPVNYLKSGVERIFPVSLVSFIVLSTAVASLSLWHIQFY